MSQTVLRFPRINRTLWYRTAGIARHRRHHGPGLQAFLKHASLNADAAGRIRDVPRMISTYAGMRHISERAAWKALRTAVDTGWIRCTQKAAPGYTARYELQLPVHLVPNTLPEDLARALRLYDDEALPEPDHADTRVGHLSHAPITRHHTSSETGNSREVQTSPLYARASFPLCSSTRSYPGEMTPAAARRGRQHGPRREPLTGPELTAARDVLVRCEPWWGQQRGAMGVLSAAEVAELIEPVAYALRRSTPTELVELLTVQTRTARSLPHVVGKRVWTLIRSRVEHHRARHSAVAADEAGGRYGQMLARGDDERAAVTTRTQQLREQLREHITRQRHEAQLQASTSGQPNGGRGWAREADDVFASEREHQELPETAADVRALYRAAAFGRKPSR